MRALCCPRSLRDLHTPTPPRPHNRSPMGCVRAMHSACSTSCPSVSANPARIGGIEGAGTAAACAISAASAAAATHTHHHTAAHCCEVGGDRMEARWRGRQPAQGHRQLKTAGAAALVACRHARTHPGIQRRCVHEGGREVRITAWGRAAPPSAHASTHACAHASTHMFTLRRLLQLMLQ